MKSSIFVVVFMSVLLVVPIFAQQNDTVVVKKSDLTADQLKRLEAQQITEKIGQYADWAEMGRGVGIAIRESLTAVKEVAVDFSKTDIGKFTMFLVGWKIMAKDVISMGDMIIGYLVGIPLLTVGLSVIVWSYRRQCVARPVLIEKGPGFWIWRSTKYQIYDPSTGNGNVDQEEWVWFHIFAAGILILICCLMMFSGN